MYNYIICLNFNNTTENNGFYQAISSLGECRQVLPCAWILISELESISIKDKLVTCNSTDDMFFISRLSTPADAAWLNLSPDSTDWLKSKL